MNTKTIIIIKILLIMREQDTKNENFKWLKMIISHEWKTQN